MKYYGINDFSTRYYHSYVIDFIKNYENIKLVSINDYLLLYNVMNYAYEVELNINKEKLVEFLDFAKKKLGEYFGRLRISNNTFNYNDIDNQYKYDFWECCSNYNNLNKVSAKIFKDFLIDNDVSIYSILENKRIVTRYNNVIKEILLENPVYFEFFINYYSHKQTSIHLPNNLTEEEVEKWANTYLASLNSNLNYLEKLSMWSKHHAFKLNDQLVLKAKRTYKNKTETVFKNEANSQFIIQVKLIEKLDAIIKFQLDSANHTVLINKNLLLDHTSYREILFIVFNIFDFFGEQGHYLLLPNKTENNLIDLLDQFVKFEYKYNMIDEYSKNIFKLVINAYYQLLKYKGIDLENALFSYFKEFINENYKELVFIVNSSEFENSYYSKCKSIFPEIDSIFHQYSLLREYGEIDFELLEMKSGEVDYRELQSFKSKKFGYINSEKMKILLKCLFDKNSYLSYIEKDKFIPFYQKILEGVNIKKLNEKQRFILDELRTYNLVKVDILGDIKCVDEEVWLFMFNLYHFEYVILSNYSRETVEKIESNLGMDSLKFDDKLFSIHENNYISYVLDNKQYSNGPAIRNKYIHGNNTNQKDDVHFSNYLDILMLIILFIRRIDEEISYACENKLLKI